MEGSSFFGCTAQRPADMKPAAEPVMVPGGAQLAALGFAALTSMPLATILIGPMGLAFVNEAADRLLARADGLLPCGIHHGISAEAPEEAQQLRRAIADAISGGSTATVAITRRKAALPLLLSITPLRDELFSPRSGDFGFAMVLIHDPLAGSAISGTRAMISLYGLTDAEAHVASGILRGRSAKRIAGARNVSVATVRSQIRQILAKTNCANQNEFVCRLSWLCAMP